MALLCKVDPLYINSVFINLPVQGPAILKELYFILYSNLWGSVMHDKYLSVS